MGPAATFELAGARVCVDHLSRFFCMKLATNNNNISENNRVVNDREVCVGVTQPLHCNKKVTLYSIIADT